MTKSSLSLSLVPGVSPRQALSTSLSLSFCTGFSVSRHLLPLRTFSPKFLLLFTLLSALSLHFSLSKSSFSLLRPCPHPPISLSPFLCFVLSPILSLCLSLPICLSSPSLDDSVPVSSFLLLSHPDPPLILSLTPSPICSPSLLVSLFVSLSLSPSLSGYFSVCVSLSNFLLLPAAASPKFLPPPFLFHSLWVSLFPLLLVSLCLSPSLSGSLSLFSLSFLLPPRPCPPIVSLPPPPLCGSPIPSGSPPPPSLLPPSLVLQLRTLPSDTGTKLSPHLFFFFIPTPTPLGPELRAAPQPPLPPQHPPTRSDAWVLRCWGRGSSENWEPPGFFWGGCRQGGSSSPSPVHRRVDLSLTEPATMAAL
ncbi:proline-rich protein 36-like [Acinonyx jubatus]|uniref:Proline-rich protein 36-like n=1 Tax=Acinonyx jubatus TaxID=32536 RepID=A0ABM3P331_ACIJB|nr:proline-rich protein 36-like [Acinonyx jubatus]